MEALRTPDDRFNDLPGYPWAPNYLDDLAGYEGLRAHYLDEGPKEAAQTFLCLHGEPSWSYLYRRMIPPFLASGARIVAPDLFGFGKSDKPVEDSAYSFHFHRNFLIAFVERLDLTNITLVVQDWGGLLGLTLPVSDAIRPRIARLLAMNTTLAVGKSPGPGFDAWRAFAAANPDMAVGDLFGRSCPHLTAAERAAYDAPFPDIRYKAGVRAFPTLVMTDQDMEGVAESRAAARFWSQAWEGPTFMAVGEADPVLGPPVMDRLRETIRRCPPPMMIARRGVCLLMAENLRPGRGFTNHRPCSMSSRR